MEFAPTFMSLIIVSSSLLGCTCHTETSFKRSDDPNPLENVVMQQAEVISQLQAKLASMETEMTSIKSRMAKQESKVAFNVRLSTSLKSFTGSETLVLDAVDVNLGQGYDRLTGIFTAPVSGVYEFNLHISHVPPGQLHVKIAKNGHEVAEVEASGDDMKYNDRSANSVILHLTHNDKVWVRREAGDSSVTEIRGTLQTSFSGVLIVADNP